MAYVPAWERLSDAVTRVMATTGLSQDEVRSDMCRAIADGEIKIRGKPWKHTTRPYLRASDTVLERKDFLIPTEITPEDLDWEKSRPAKPWFVQRNVSTAHWGHWELEWIELSRTDVTNVLCAAGTQGEVPSAGSIGATSGGPPPLEGTPVGAGPRPAAGPQKPGTGSARRRGAQPIKLERTKDAMRSEILQGRRTVAELKNMPEKDFSPTYGVSRDTARKARTAVLSEFDEN